MPKYLKTGFVRDLEFQLLDGDISYTYMLEMIQNEVVKNYKKDNTFMKKMKRFFSEVWLGITLSNHIKQNHQQFGKF